MPFYRNHVYPHLVSMLGDPKPIQKIRQHIVPWAQGKVLEIGVGPGGNVMHYDPARVSKVYALEPNPGMIRMAEQRRRQTQLDVEFLDLPGERKPSSLRVGSQKCRCEDETSEISLTRKSACRPRVARNCLPWSVLCFSLEVSSPWFLGHVRVEQNRARGVPYSPGQKRRCLQLNTKFVLLLRYSQPEV